ncbi:MAG: acylneuraminate cytidylyltransferase family protein [Pirellulales bacterium]|nr:acylneuraminate cytidylyltransferase family protein [Pirellulales bacterium]
MKSQSPHGFRVLGIIPARGGSKRLPRKNLCMLGGKTLVARALETALAAERLTRVVVSSEHPEILALARSYGDEYALQRPEEISRDTSMAIEFVHHALGALEGAGEPRFDAVAIVQPSSPLTRPSDIDATIELLETSGAESCVTVAKIEQSIHPYKLKTLRGDQLVPYFEDERGRMAQHQLPPLYARNGSVYATRRDVINRGKVLGDDCRAVVMPREYSVDINDEIDLQFAEFLVERHPNLAAPNKVHF